MSKNNVRIAIRDSTDSHNVAFFDNKAGIKYKSANLHRFLAGSASILTIKYNSKDIDSIRSGCKLAFRYKNRDYWLNVMSFEKKGFEVELTAYSLGLELNNETRGEHKPANAMSIAEYVGYYDPEHALTIGVNEVSDKRIKLEWTGTDTILARLFSVANSFGAELDFSVELNDDYSLKRQVLNIYKKGNLGTNKVSQPVRVGKELKVINYSDNIKELRTAVRATGKDGLTIDGLNKKIYDNNKELLYYSSGMTVYAPQSRDRFPSVGKGSNDNWIVEDLGETQYETKEALWGYLYSEIQKKSLPEITYEVEGAIEAGIGDTQTLIDDIHFEPALYVQARVSELEDDILTGKVTKSTFINFERKYSQIADILLKQVEALAEDAAPYIIRLSTDNGYIFKNGEGSSTITARLEKYSKDIAATWKWVVDNKVVGTGDKLTVKAEQVTNTMAATVIAYVNGNEVVRDYMTFSNSDDGVGVESIDRHFTSSDKSDGVTIEGAEWSDKPPAPTEDGKYLWAYDEITYTDGTVTTTKPAAVGANFDVDAFRAEIAEDLKDVPNREEFENKIAEELANSKAEIETQIETAKTQAESSAKEYADTINQETAKVAELANAAAGEIKADLVNVKNNLTSTSLVANNAQAAVDAAKQDLANVASDLSTAKQDLANSVDAVNTKVDSAKEELTQAKQDLANVASDLNTAKQDLADSVSAVNTKVDNAKAELTQTKQQLTTVSEDLSKAKTDLQNAVSAVDTKATNLQSDLSQAKQDLASHAQQLQTQANAQSELTKRVSSVEKTADGTKTTVSELSKTVAQNGKDITSVTARTKTVEDDLTGTKTTLSQVKTTADSTSQKTATLETGLNGLNARFDSLKIGSVNLLKNSKTFTGSNITGVSTLLNETYQGCAVRYFKNTNPNSPWQDVARFNECVYPKLGGEYVTSFWAKGTGELSIFFYNGLSVDSFVTSQVVSGNLGDGRATFTLSENWQRYWIKYKLKTEPASATSIGKHLLFRHNNSSTEDEIYLAGAQLEEGNVATDYSPNEADLEQKVAEYKQNADQNYASLQTTVQNLDGTVQHNKTVADQTAAGFKTRIESLETYKDGESERANAYFESAKTETAKQLTAERTAIAKDYVAKSTYTSDVTGIRNELSATTSTANTTKTNLANYQASNDRAVANLQSNLQTANGNISSLQTKVEAVPGQITSAVSSVESKIPTEIGAVNLLKNSKSFTGSNIGGSGTILSETYQGCAVRHLKITGEVAIAEFRNCVYPKLGGEYVASFWAKGRGILRVFFHGDSGYLQVASGLTSEGDTNTRSDGLFEFNLTANWKRYWIKYKLKSEPASATSVGKHLLFRTPPNGSENEVYLAGAQLEEGNVVSGYEPAPEDTTTQISNLSSQIQQTADGMTLLATKTELNTAKSDLQSGISTATNKANTAQSTADSAVTKANAAQSAANSNAQTISTHTTQISALNTGLSAKVSQTDFNTLSGRVTTAENNITAKANELSSKISSVEGKIPTSVGGRNLLSKTNQGKTNWSWRISSDGTTAEDYDVDGVNAVKLTRTSDASYTSYTWHYIQYDGLIRKLIEPNTKYTLSFDVKPSVDVTFSAALQRGDKSAPLTNAVNMNEATANQWTKVSCVLTSNATLSDDTSQVAYLQGMPATNGNWLIIKNIKLEKSAVPSDWSPAPEDTATQISNLSSEIKQTADGMTMLATKTELNSAKTDLQSGISTATNKADTAQNTANNNAQTISTHTTQISALNTGLQAKVSQSEFNTLSGRVTSAENNITAKANELSSKITSVEGAIEDTQSDITKLSSEIKQTADGMTLLATKTELNTAKSDLQSGISTATNKANTAQSTADSAVTKANAAQSAANSNAQTISTHTTQISALNTGLSAKVSQTDFNTLSGRVTTAENNITAKANELSSKISSVEGKIPTSVGGRNLLSKTNQGKTNWSWRISSDGTTAEDYDVDGVNAVKLTRTSDASYTSYTWHYIQYDGLIRKLIEPNTKYTLSFDVKPSVDVTFSAALQRGDKSAPLTNAVNMNEATANQWTKVSCVLTSNATLSDDTSQVAYLQGMPATNGNWLIIKNIKLEKGAVPSDWSPAPEDTATQISNLSSEIKQTADGMTMLATKTELNSAKTDLQSGISTATNKADTAQNTANNNAQTISTHTTQISALNTGLQAKVSQSEFNTLSGRVTTAENNITAKANELTSKISSVEGKIPTNKDFRNLYVIANSSVGYLVSGSTNLGAASPGTKERTSDYIPVEAGKKYTFQGWITLSGDQRGWRAWQFYNEDKSLNGGRRAEYYTSDYQRFQLILTAPTGAKWLRVSASLYNDGKIMVEKGDEYHDYMLAPEDAISETAITQAQSEFKQTTDAIKASVSSVQTAASNAQSTANTAVSKADAAQAGVNTLDSTTVKSASLTINADGIVMKAGKSTTDVANAIGSYFAVNQNAINLFSDKINVKGNMIVNGAITSDKIASKSINTAHLNGKIITADVISSNAVTAGAIKAGAVTTDKMSANSINGDRITSGTLDAAKIKAGSITASQIASGTITSNQIKAGGISSANIAAGAITGDKIAAGAIDASKIAANAITANMITGGKLNSTNGATSFDLNAGTLTFNNNSGYIQRVASDKVFEITTLLSRDLDSRDYLTSAFNIRKSDNSRQAGVKFTLYNTIADKPTAEAKINADALILYDSKNTRLFSVHGNSTFMGNLNMPDWGDIPIAKVHGGLVVNDIGIGGHTKSLLKIVEELCKKAGILWV